MLAAAIMCQHVSCASSQPRVVPVFCFARGKVASLGKVSVQQGRFWMRRVCLFLGNCTVQRCVGFVACRGILKLADIAAAQGSTGRGCRTKVAERLLDLHSTNDGIYADR